MKVKQLGANMKEQVTRALLHPFLSFINCYNASKVHNMLAFMLDPCFKDLSFVGDCVGHASIIEIPGHAYDAHFLLPTQHELYKKMQGHLVISNVYKEIVHNTNIVFEVRVSEMEMIFEQVSFLFLLCVYVTSDLISFLFYM
jgi:hypothetical protein